MHIPSLVTSTYLMMQNQSIQLISQLGSRGRPADRHYAKRALFLKNQSLMRTMPVSPGLWREDTYCQTQAAGGWTDGRLLLMLLLSCSGLRGLMGLETVMLSCFFTLNWREWSLWSLLPFCLRALVYITPIERWSCRLQVLMGLFL